MARAILRASINGPRPNNQMAQMGKILKAGGFQSIGTGAYEGDASPAVVRDVLRDVLDFFDAMDPRWELDHLWIYVDDTVP